MENFSHAHEREQAEAALNECCRILRRIGVSALCAVGTERGHVYRLMSAPNGSEQTHLMLTISTKLNLELGEMATLAAECVDEQNGPNFIDEAKRRMEEEDEEE
jgi:hypothetical protein